MSVRPLPNLRSAVWVVAVTVAGLVCVLGGEDAWQLAHPQLAAPAGPAHLDELSVVDGAAPVPYDRAAFGRRWADVDRNGCDQRNDALAAAMSQLQARPGTRGCVIESGMLHDAYTGQRAPFVKSSNDVHIDHLVPLAHAWHAGAWQWEPARREQFANDLELLVPTAGAVNRAKSDSPVQDWQPPDPGARCAYADAWIEAKRRWGLSVTTDELEYLKQMSVTCVKG